MGFKNPADRRAWEREYQRRRRIEAPEKERERERRYRAHSKEREHARKSAYRKTRRAQEQERHRRRLARKKSAPPGELAGIGDYEQILRQGICEQCGSHGAIHVDHIEPLATGGAHGWDNFAGLCVTCNSSKATRPLLIAML